MQRIAVAAEPVDQSLIRPCRNIDRHVRSAFRDRVRLWLAFRRTAEAAVAARELRGDQRRQILALVILEHSLAQDHRALVLAFVEHAEDAGVAVMFAATGSGLWKVMSRSPSTTIRRLTPVSPAFDPHAATDA